VLRVSPVYWALVPGPDGLLDLLAGMLIAPLGEAAPLGEFDPEPPEDAPSEEPEPALPAAPGWCSTFTFLSGCGQRSCRRRCLSGFSAWAAPRRSDVSSWPAALSADWRRWGSPAEQVLIGFCTCRRAFKRDEGTNETDLKPREQRNKRFSRALNGYVNFAGTAP